MQVRYLWAACLVCGAVACSNADSDDADSASDPSSLDAGNPGADAAGGRIDDGPLRVALVLENTSEAGALPGRGDGPVDVAFSPGVWISHSENLLLIEGEKADEAVESLAERGQGTDLRQRLGEQGARASGLIGPAVDGDYASGMITPGERAAAVFEVQPDDRISFATMFTQSNDTMLGLVPEGIAASELDGVDEALDISDRLRWWDAGTEVNEPPGEGQSQAGCEPDVCDGDTDDGLLRTFTTKDSEGNDYPAPSEVARALLVICSAEGDLAALCDGE